MVLCGLDWNALPASVSTGWIECWEGPVPMSHCGYVEWCYVVWIGMLCQQGSPLTGLIAGKG
eukprot:scaffold204607_cov53-Cyclotella_meneghiniana.AAC.1